MTKKELDLFQLSSSRVAEAGAGAPQVMRCQFLQSNPFCRILHDVPDGFLGHALTQNLPHLRHATEDLTALDSRGVQPDPQLFHYPGRDRNRPDVSGLSLQIDNCPMFLSLIQMFDSEANGFMAAKAAGKQ
jgi:hypothetical protein